MPKKINKTALNASSIDIINTIRNNASPQFQSLIPAVANPRDIPKVGDIVMGNPSFSNEFLSALINKVAFTVARSMTFNNPYALLKKGLITTGETVEDVFVELATLRGYDVEKAPARELMRTTPKALSAYYVQNYKVQYPITVQLEELQKAFVSEVTMGSFIDRIISRMTAGHDYDEFLIFKYMLIKGVNSGKFYPVSVGDAKITTDMAIAFKTYSKNLLFPSREYNESRVLNNTPIDRQAIFLDTAVSAAYDVNVLADAFNMDKVDYVARQFLIDNWAEFDNDRFLAIAGEQIEPVTQAELDVMSHVKAILVDTEWFQVYDNLYRTDQTYVGSGIYWNYWLHSWKTVAASPFSNAIVFVDNGAVITAPATFTAKIADRSVGSDGQIVLNVAVDVTPGLKGGQGMFVQTQQAVEAGVGVEPYGTVMFPAATATPVTLEINYHGITYKSTATIKPADAQGASLTFNKA